VSCLSGLDDGVVANANVLAAPRAAGIARRAALPGVAAPFRISEGRVTRITLFKATVVKGEAQVVRRTVCLPGQCSMGRQGH
jgi:hypothetical protein